MKWKPIETAPKDGKSMLHGWSQFQSVCVGSWFTDHWGPDDSYADNYRVDPTHWMPLPEPPEDV